MTINMNHLLVLDTPSTYRQMLDYLFATIDDLLYAEEDCFPPWPTIEQFLVDVPVDEISIQLGIGILTITGPIKGRSEARRELCRKFRAKIEQTEAPDRVKRLLYGWE